MNLTQLLDQIQWTFPGSINHFKRTDRTQTGQARVTIPTQIRTQKHPNPNHTQKPFPFPFLGALGE